MSLVLERKNRIIRNSEVKQKFEEFSNGLFEDISMQLYEKDGKYFLVLAPYTDKILSSSMCVITNSGSELESVIEDLSCNIGIMLAENTGKLQKAETEEQVIQIDGKEIDLIDFEHLCIEGKNGSIKLYRDEELTQKLKSLSSKLFGKDRNEGITSYINNSMFTRMTGKRTLKEEDLKLLKYYKEEGYEFLNSFLGNGELRTRGNIAKEYVGREFIDNLYRLNDLFEKLPTLEESITVYRGVDSRDSSESINYNSFVSTSLDKNFAKNNFAKGTLYEINLPKGTHYIPMDAIVGLDGMYNESEAEILLRPSVLTVADSKIQDNLEILSVTAKEKDNFSEILLSALNRRKEELIQKGLCDENDFDEVLSYVKVKNKEYQQTNLLINTKENENKYKKYKMSIMKQISDIRRELDLISESEEDSNLEQAENKYKEAELIQKYNSLINSAKGYDLTLKEINLLEQVLEGKIDTFERSRGLQEIKQYRSNLANEGELIYSRDEVEKCQKAIDMYTLQGNQEKIDEYTIKLQLAQRQYEFAKSQIENVKEQVSTQKLGKETLDMQNDTAKIDAVEHQLNEQMKEQKQQEGFRINEFEESIRSEGTSFRDRMRVNIDSNEYARDVLNKFEQDLENGVLNQEKKKQDSQDVEKGDDDYVM